VYVVSTASEMDRVLTSAAEGHPLEPEDALEVMDHAELEPLLEAARCVRERFHGRTVSF
jgi:2-iminoacetate synthase ThiH